MSTEQILHPELYPDELPVDIDLPDVAELGSAPGWTTAYEQTLGEMQTGVWVADGRKAARCSRDCRRSCRAPARLPDGAATAW